MDVAAEDAGVSRKVGHQAAVLTTGTAPSDKGQSELSAFQIYAEFRELNTKPQTQSHLNAGEVQLHLQIQRSSSVSLTN